MVTAVIFDMDGVLLDSEPIYRDCWRRAAARLGFEMRDEMYARVVGRTNSDAEKVLCEEFGSRFSLDDFRQEWVSDWEQRVRRTPIPMKSGVPELLDFLDRHQVRKAIATSTERAKALLSLRDLGHRFDTVVTGDEIERGKPQPDIFLAAAEKLTCQPGSCWVIEDSDAGVRAAHAAGMRAVIVPDLREPSHDVVSLAECVCRSLHEVRDVLARELSS